MSFVKGLAQGFGKPFLKMAYLIPEFEPILSRMWYEEGLLMEFLPWVVVFNPKWSFIKKELRLSLLPIEYAPAND